MKEKGRFGDYGGFYVPEVLIPALEELEEAFYRFRQDKKFVTELDQLYADYAGRPTPLYFAKRFSDQKNCFARKSHLPSNKGDFLLEKACCKSLTLPKSCALWPLCSRR